MNRDFNDDNFHDEQGDNIDEMLQEIDNSDMALILTLEGLEECTFEHINLNTRFRVFHDHENNNTIIFTPHISNVSFIEIIDSVNEEAYMYLLDMLAVNFNMVVEWSLYDNSEESEDKESSYTIYYDVNLSEDEKCSYLKIKKKLDEILGDSIGELNGKYNEIEMNEVLGIDDLIDELGDFYE